MILAILKYPDKRLRAKARDVEFPLSEFDRQLVDDLLETLLAAETQRKSGVAIGATQVGAPRRVVVIERGKCGMGEGAMAMINPRIVFADDKHELDDEGCLSLPGVFAPVRRPVHMTVDYQDEDGETHAISVEGFAARVISHELDHLNGKIILDHLPADAVAATKAALWRRKHK